MRGIMFIGGEGPSPEAIRKIAAGANLFVAADSGLILCESAGLKPDWILGDMDSLVCEANQDGLRMLEKYPPERVLRFREDKDYTDTELALNFLQEKSCDEIWLLGGGGGRLDHLFAIRSLFERNDPPHRWFPGNEEVRCLLEGQKLNMTLPSESLVSVFPIGNEAWEAESSGLKWPLKGLAWDRGSFGVSNVATTGPFEIRSVKGRFLVICPMCLNDF